MYGADIGTEVGKVAVFGFWVWQAWQVSIVAQGWSAGNALGASGPWHTRQFSSPGIGWGIAGALVGAAAATGIVLGFVDNLWQIVQTSLVIHGWLALMGTLPLVGLWHNRQLSSPVVW
jgi:hypothetical protein